MQHFSSRVHSWKSLLWLLDEKDVFESDFESTDEEAERQLEVSGEAEVTQEENRIRKVRFSSSSFCLW